MEYSKINLEILIKDQDIAIAFLMDIADSFEQKEANLIVYFKQKEANFESLHQVLKLPFFKGQNVVIEKLEPINWNAEWEANFDSITIEGFCQIRAPFHEVDPYVPFHFLLSPKMAFGTGHHETSYMMLKFIEKLELENKSIFDFGCGTGILGLIAKIRGAKRLVMVDIEESAIENSLEHSLLNKLKVDSLLLGDLESVPVEIFDTIFANINRDVILNSFSVLKEYTHNETVLLISGYLKSDKELVHSKASDCDWQVLETTEKGKWLCSKLKPKNKYNIKV